MNIEELRGTVVKLIFQNKDNWYSVCDVETDTKELVTVVGIMPCVAKGEGIFATGSWIFTKDYGRQFKAETYEKLLPENTNEILRYLSSGAIKGIGAKIAQKIVEKYGDDSFDVIENHPDWLVDIKGISRKKAYEISNDFREKSGIREILTALNGAVSTTVAVKIHKKWGRNALGRIKENPYDLCTGYLSIGFKRADEIAKELGISKTDKNRIVAAIKYILEIFASRDGHTYVEQDRVCEAASKLLEIDRAHIEQIILNTPLDFVHFEKQGNKILLSLKDLYEAEKYISKKLLDINRKAAYLNGANIQSILDRVEYDYGIEYAKLQKKAILECVANGVTVLTGGPGTGKTTVIKAVIQIFSYFGMDCALCAPTGRAAKRLNEATGNEARTIHRLLEVNVNLESDEPSFMRNAGNHLDEEVIIVDEASMIDVSLMKSLLDAVKLGARLILVGDTNQLPSVGEGNVLNDIISSEAFKVVELTEIFRQAENSGIVVNAHKINKGQMPDLKSKYEDFFFVQKSDEEIPFYIANLCKERIPKKYGEGIVNQIQVITPQKVGNAGTRCLNHALQEKINPQNGYKSECGATRERILRVGDRVMQIRNNYEAEWHSKNGKTGNGVFNGDIGIIKDINNEEKGMIIDFGDREIEYTFSEIEEIDHSYAITVHKSQGSEYPIVIVPISSSCSPLLLTRNLIYTAITRASKMVVLVGDVDTLKKMIDNNSKQKRNTYLENMIRKCANEYS